MAVTGAKTQSFPQLWVRKLRLPTQSFGELEAFAQSRGEL